MPPAFMSRPLPVSRAATHPNPLRTLALWVLLSFGFFLQFDIFTNTLGLRFQRLTDGLLFLYTPYLFLLVGIGPTLRYGTIYFITLFAAVFASLLLKTGVEQGDMYLTLVYLLTGVFCFYFAILARDERFLIYFSVGTLIGLLPSLVVLFLQGNGYTRLWSIGLGVPTDQLSPLQKIYFRTKLGGLWAGGNEAGHVYAVATASALYLAFRFRRPMIYILAYGLLVASFAFTLNRAGLIAPTIALIYCYVRLGDYFLYMKTAIVAVLVLLVLVLTTNFSGLDQFYDAFQRRFLADQDVSSNVALRFGSNIASLGIALEHPFGIGYVERTTLMVHRTDDGVISAHNGFLSLAYQAGIAVPILYILSGLYLFVQRRSVSSFYVMMFLFTAASMLFEELSVNQFFIFSVAMTIAAAWLDYAARVRGHTTEAGRPLTRRTMVSR